MRLVWAKQSKLGWCLIMFWTTEQKSTDFSSCYFEKQWEVELLEKFGRQAVILDRYTVEHDLANVRTHLGNADEVSIVIASYDYSSKLIKRFPHVKWDFLIIDEAHNLRNVFHGTKRAKKSL